MRHRQESRERRPLRFILRWWVAPAVVAHALSAETPFRQLKISFVTGNKMKAGEVNRILADHGATKGPTPDNSMVDLNVLTV